MNYLQLHFNLLNSLYSSALFSSVPFSASIYHDGIAMATTPAATSAARPAPGTIPGTAAPV